jgi:hypothetical protein
MSASVTVDGQNAEFDITDQNGLTKTFILDITDDIYLYPSAGMRFKYLEAFNGLDVVCDDRGVCLFLVLSGVIL